MKLTYQHLVEIVDGDHELIARLVEEGEITVSGETATVDVEHVMVARTLVRELDIDWTAVGMILRLRDELAAARKRIAELERT
jgi:hypothetical protein